MATTSFLMMKPDGSNLNSLVSELCHAEYLNGRFIIEIPVVSYSGSSVCVTVWPEGVGHSYLVTDDGLAHREVVNALASERIFARTVDAKCQRYGACFDGGSMLFMRVPREKLKGAIIAMASLTKEVIDETIERSFAAKFDAAQEIFVRNAAIAFSEFKRQEHATVYGQSTSAYDFDLVVDLGKSNLAFQFFSKSGNSVNSTFVSFSDVSRSDDSPRLVGVTARLGDIGPKLTLISSIASVIEANSNPKIYRQFAA